MPEGFKFPLTNAFLYPWNQPLWENFRACWEKQRLPHALLLAGPVGMGKQAFAASLVQALSCEKLQEDGQGCHSCTGCRLQRAGSHPDNFAILPREGKQVISIDQIRQVQAHLALKARQSHFKTITIFPAEEMTLNAANSLLKVLEEPPGEAVIILITSAFSRLPITVLSRCQRLWFTPPKSKEAQAWLKKQLSADVGLDLTTLLALTEGAPLKALEYVEQGMLARRHSFIEGLFSLAQGKAEPLDIAQNWLKNDLQEPLYWVSTLVGDMIRVKNGVSAQYLFNRDMADSLQIFAQNIPFKVLFALWEKVNYDLWLWKGQIQVNPQLLLEGLLIQWSLCFNEVNHEYT